MANRMIIGTARRLLEMVHPIFVILVPSMLVPSNMSSQAPLTASFPDGKTPS
jgi:hypothetical protein